MVNKFMHLGDTISCLICGTIFTRMNLSKMSKLGHPCNKLRAVSLVAAHSTSDVKQNV